MKKLTPETLITLFLSPQTGLQLTISDWQSVLLILRQEKLLARYRQRLHRAGVLSQLPEGVVRHFNNAHILALHQQRLVQYEAKSLQKLLHPKGIQLTFLKGAGYTLSGNNASCGRVYSDIDILVDKSSINNTERALALAGWFSQTMDDYDQAYYRHWAHEIPPLSHATRGTVLDVHHNLVPPVSGKALDVSKFLEHCRVTNLNDHQLGTLNPAGMFFHSAIHLFFSEDFSHAFRDMTDLFLLLEEHKQALANTLPFLVKTFGFAREIALALHFLVKDFAVELPPELLKLQHPEKPVAKLSLNILAKAISPAHDLIDVPYKSLCDSLAEARGHILKMPMHILCYHMLMKAYRSTVETALGEHFFTKDESKTRLNR